MQLQLLSWIVYYQWTWPFLLFLWLTNSNSKSFHIWYLCTWINEWIVVQFWYCIRFPILGFIRNIYEQSDHRIVVLCFMFQLYRGGWLHRIVVLCFMFRLYRGGWLHRIVVLCFMFQLYRGGWLQRMRL